ncbi:MAG TPA: SIMPL domain-containing protein [Anaeromyxobacteraceae bacterium]|nr:SIMPL domain-containing protein [Anaeromyxobacteraceae bacterium]
MNVPFHAAAAAAALALALSPSPSALAAGFDAAAPATQRSIRVTGEGRVSAQPDIAIVSVGVEALGPTVSAATAEGSRRMRAVLDALAAEGVSPKDIRTSQYNVSMERAWKDGKPGPITGYRVSNTVEVRVRNLSRLGGVLERVTQAGSNLVGSLQMDREDPSAEQLRALRVAYASARAKAEALAKAAGVELGEVLSIYESSGPAPRPLRRTLAVEAAPQEVPVAEGELTYTAGVEAVFAFR